MLEIILGGVALGSLALLLVLGRRVVELERRLSLMGSAIPLEPQAPSLPEPPRAHPLEGLRIAIAVSQDHTHPVFAILLKDRLLEEDGADVVLLSAADSTPWPDAVDILISGSVQCNGYTEIYYRADLSCRSPNQEICNLAEKPPHGDRQANLAIELVSKLETEIEKLVVRHERRRAIRELRGY